MTHANGIERDDLNAMADESDESDGDLTEEESSENNSESEDEVYYDNLSSEDKSKHNHILNRTRSKIYTCYKVMNASLLNDTIRFPENPKKWLSLRKSNPKSMTFQAKQKQLDSITPNEPDTALSRTIFPFIIFSPRFKSACNSKKSQKVSTNMTTMIMLDSCSDVNYVVKSFVQKLQNSNPALIKDLGEETLPIRTIRGVHKAKYQVIALKLSLKSYTIEEKFYILDSLGDSPLSCQCASQIIQPFLHRSGHLIGKLLHNTYAPKRSPDILLGNPHSLALATGGIHKLTPRSSRHTILLIKTPVGDVPAGKVRLETCNCIHQTNTSGTSNFATNDALSKAIYQLFKHENLDSDANCQSAISAEDYIFLKAMQKTVFDPKLGRYIVAQPWKTEQPPDFYNNYNSVAMRFKALENQIKKLDPSKEQMEELNQSVLEHIKNNKYVLFENEKEATDPKSKLHFLPFRMVVSPNSSTTRLRATLDGSCSSGLPDGRAHGPSLNSFLCVGPNSLPSQFKLHVAFRANEIALTADISRFFLCIGVKDSDTRYQNFLFRPFCSDEPLRPYCIKVISWGLAPSVAQCSYVIRQHAQKILDDPKASDGLKRAAHVIQNQLYADNLLAGVKSVQEGIELYQNVEKLFELGGFKVAKWTSSSPSVMSHIPLPKRCKENLLELRTPEGDSVEMTSKQRILGESLDLVKDEYLCGGFKDLVNEFDPKKGVTKRILASYLAKVSFSHLNLKTPVTIFAKKLLQEVCIYEQTNPQIYEDLKPKERWDKQLPKVFADKFMTWLRELPNLDKLSFSRYCFNSPGYTAVAFCDAGSSSVCSLIYLRAFDQKLGKYRANLLACRVKILPLQTVLRAETIGPSISVPRAELWALSLCAEMCEEVMAALNLSSDRIQIFTDSQCCLSWIKLAPDRLSDWHMRKLAVLRTHRFKVAYVASGDNPSDLGSKPGTTVKDLQSNFFKHGPSWLVQPRQSWPINPPEFNLTSESYVSGLKRATVDINYKTTLATFHEKHGHLFSDFSFSILDGYFVTRTNDFPKLKARLGRLLRVPLLLKYRSLKKKDKTLPDLNLTIDSQKEAILFLIRFHQAKEFKEEYKHLLKQEGAEQITPVDAKSLLRPLRPKIVRKGYFKVPLIVTAGRLVHGSPEAQLLIVTAGHLSQDQRHLNDTSVNLIWNIARSLHLGENFSKIHVPHLTLVHELRKFGLHVIRDKFFAKQIVTDCVPCGRHNSRAARLQVQPLPRSLADPVIRDGLNDGVLSTMTEIALDRFGPLLIHAHNPFATKIRKRNLENRTKKVWVNLFLDLVSGYLNFEISPSLNAQDIGLALDSHSHKFGSPNCLYLDNEKAFQKLGEQLDEIFDKQEYINDLSRMAHAKGIKTRFSFPLNPSQNGKVEHLVGTVKKSLAKTYKAKIFSFYELHHSLTAACAVVNSRPLAYLESDSDTNIFHPSQILSPKSIIFGRNIYQHNLPFQSVADQQEIAEIWEQRRKIVRDFTEAFLKFYLPESNQSKAFQTESDEIRVGDIVLAPKQVSQQDKKETKTLPGSGGPQSHGSKSLWPLGTVIQLLKSAQGVPVAAKIRLGDAKYVKRKGKFKFVRPGTIVTRSIRSLRIIKAFQNLTRNTETENKIKVSKGTKRPQMKNIFEQTAKQSPIIPLHEKVLEENSKLKLRSGKNYERKVYFARDPPDVTHTYLNAKECFIYDTSPVAHCCD